MEAHKSESAINMVDHYFSFIKMDSFWKIIIGFFGLLILTVLPACSETDGKEDFILNKDTFITIEISPLTRSESSSIEVIKSLRIILLDPDGRLKANEYITYEEAKSLDKYFHNCELKTVTGKNKIFVIANEASIEEFNFEEGPKDYRKSLTDFLNSLAPGNSGIENSLKTLYFIPNYNKPIPLSCYYELELKEDNGSKSTVPQNNFTLFLVNVATKLEINFYNYRNDDVIFKNVSIEKIADYNYLIANIEDSEKNKVIDGKSYYWIDWLKKVSEDTQNHPNLDESNESNNIINDKWGWLTNYKMPSITEHENFNLISNNDTWKIERSKEGQVGDKPIPGEFPTITFYLPESKFIPQNESVQSYKMVFEIYSNNEESKIIETELGYVKTLFRNTKVKVNIELYEGSLEIFAQIVKWKETGLIYGTLTQE